MLKILTLLRVSLASLTQKSAPGLRRQAMQCAKLE